LKKLPDHAPLSVIQKLEEKSTVLPVPVDDDCIQSVAGAIDRPLTLLWNHRWEYDKGPECLYLVLKSLRDRGIDFRIHIIGQQFRKKPDVFNRIQQRFQSQIASWGYIESRQAYLHILQQSDIVLSTALHDFQGIAILEAVACGCIPVVPDRLAYPDFIPASFRTDSFDEPTKDAASIADGIINISRQTESYRKHMPDLSRLFWSRMAELYRGELQR